MSISNSIECLSPRNSSPQTINPNVTISSPQRLKFSNQSEDECKVASIMLRSLSNLPLPSINVSPFESSEDIDFASIEREVASELQNTFSSQTVLGKRSIEGLTPSFSNISEERSCGEAAGNPFNKELLNDQDPACRKRMISKQQVAKQSGRVSESSHCITHRRDRFIPERRNVNFGIYDLNTERRQSSSHSKGTPLEINYRKDLIKTLLKNRNPETHPILYTPTRNDKSAYCSQSERAVKRVKINQPTLQFEKSYSVSPDSVGTIGAIVDDFYANRLAYSPQTGLALIRCCKFLETGVTDQVALLNQSLLCVNDNLCKDPLHPQKCIHSIAFYQEGKGILLGSIVKRDDQSRAINRLEFWVDQGGEWVLKKTIPFNSRINAITPIGNSIFVGTNDGEIIEIDATIKTVLASYKIKGADPAAESSIISLVSSPSGKYLAAGTNAECVVIIDRSIRRIVRQWDYLGAGIRAIAFNPANEAQIAIGGGMRSPYLRIYNFLEGIQYAAHDFKNQFTGIFWTRDNVLISTHEKGVIVYTPVDPKQPQNMLGECQGFKYVLIEPQRRMIYPIFDSRPNGKSSLFAAQGELGSLIFSTRKDPILRWNVPESDISDQLLALMDGNSEMDLRLSTEAFIR